jgi:hypothetical protein
LSEIRVTTISDTAGTGPVTLTKQHAAKAWAQVDGNPVGLNGSFNVASATDIAAGHFSIAFTSNMSAATYAVPAETDLQANRIEAGYIAASGFRVVTELTSGTDHDATYSMFAVHGDLA